MKGFLLLAPCLLLTGGVTRSKAPDDPCKLFTQSEIKTLLGVPLPVDAGSPSIAGCQWATADDESYAQIEIIEDTSYYEPHKGAKGLPGAHRRRTVRMERIRARQLGRFGQHGPIRADCHGHEREVRPGHRDQVPQHARGAGEINGFVEMNLLYREADSSRSLLPSFEAMIAKALTRCLQ